MGQFDLLQYIVRILEEMDLAYFVTGSTATIFYGEPRFTNDIDIVVDLSERQVVEFCVRFPPDQFYVSLPAAKDAVRRRGQFNIIHPDSGLKADIMIPAGDLFNRSRFARTKRVHTANDVNAYFASPEDAIIKKLEYFKEGGSEKHLRDIAGVLKTNALTIDMAYIWTWARQLGLEDIWEEVQRRAASDKPNP